MICTNQLYPATLLTIHLETNQNTIQNNLRPNTAFNKHSGALRVLLVTRKPLLKAFAK